MPTNTMGTLVGIHPTTMEHLESIRRYGGWYWKRESYNGHTRLIPVKEGIPYVADFIFVPNENVRSRTDLESYNPQLPTASEAAVNGSKRR